MHPSFLLAQLHADSSLDRLAHSALPTAPVQPYMPRRRLPAWPAALRVRRNAVTSPALHGSHAAA